MSYVQVSPWRAKGAGLLTGAIVFIYTAVRLETQLLMRLICQSLSAPSRRARHAHWGFFLPHCQTHNAESASDSIMAAQVVLFNALSSEPEDDACIRLTGVSGGLQVSRSSHQYCLPMHACNVMQCLDVTKLAVQAHSK